MKKKRGINYNRYGAARPFAHVRSGDGKNWDGTRPTYLVNFLDPNQYSFTRSTEAAIVDPRQNWQFDGGDEKYSIVFDEINLSGSVWSVEANQPLLLKDGQTYETRYSGSSAILQNIETGETVDAKVISFEFSGTSKEGALQRSERNYGVETLPSLSNLLPASASYSTPAIMEWDQVDIYGSTGAVKATDDDAGSNESTTTEAGTLAGGNELWGSLWIKKDEEIDTFSTFHFILDSEAQFDIRIRLDTGEWDTSGLVSEGEWASVVPFDDWFLFRFRHPGTGSDAGAQIRVYPATGYKSSFPVIDVAATGSVTFYRPFLAGGPGNLYGDILDPGGLSGSRMTMDDRSDANESYQAFLLNDEILEGETVDFSIWVKRDEASPTFPRIRLDYEDENGNTLDGTYSNQFFIHLASGSVVADDTLDVRCHEFGDWFFVEGTNVANRTYKNANIRIYPSIGYVDDFPSAINLTPTGSLIYYAPRISVRDRINLSIEPTKESVLQITNDDFNIIPAPDTWYPNDPATLEYGFDDPAGGTDAIRQTDTSTTVAQATRTEYRELISPYSVIGNDLWCSVWLKKVEETDHLTRILFQVGEGGRDVHININPVTGEYAVIDGLDITRELHVLEFDGWFFIAAKAESKGRVDADESLGRIAFVRTYPAIDRSDADIDDGTNIAATGSCIVYGPRIADATLHPLESNPLRGWSPSSGSWKLQFENPSFNKSWAGANEPRFLSDAAVLIEGERTNYIGPSAVLTASIWSGSLAAVSSGSEAPDGSNDAWRISSPNLSSSMSLRWALDLTNDENNLLANESWTAVNDATITTGITDPADGADAVTIDDTSTGSWQIGRAGVVDYETGNDVWMSLFVKKDLAATDEAEARIGYIDGDGSGGDALARARIHPATGEFRDFVTTWQELNAYDVGDWWLFTAKHEGNDISTRMYLDVFPAINGSDSTGSVTVYGPHLSIEPFTSKLINGSDNLPDPSVASLSVYQKSNEARNWDLYYRGYDNLLPDAGSISWNANAGTMVTASVADPFGGTDAVRLIENTTTANANVRIGTGISYVSGSELWAAFYVKKNEDATASTALRIDFDTGLSVALIIDPSTGLVYGGDDDAFVKEEGDWFLATLHTDRGGDAATAQPRIYPAWGRLSEFPDEENVATGSVTVYEPYLSYKNPDVKIGMNPLSSSIKKWERRTLDVSDYSKYIGYQSWMSSSISASIPPIDLWGWQVESGSFPTSPIRVPLQDASGSRSSDVLKFGTTPGAFTASVWQMDFWPEFGSGKNGDAFKSIISFNSNNGAYLQTIDDHDDISFLTIFGTDGAAIETRRPITFDKNQKITMTVYPEANEIYISGTTTGEGMLAGFGTDDWDDVLNIGTNSSTDSFPFYGVLGMPKFVYDAPISISNNRFVSEGQFSSASYYYLTSAIESPATQAIMFRYEETPTNSFLFGSGIENNAEGWGFYIDSFGRLKYRGADVDFLVDNSLLVPGNVYCACVTFDGLIFSSSINGSSIIANGPSVSFFIDILNDEENGFFPPAGETSWTGDTANVVVTSGIVDPNKGSDGWEISSSGQNFQSAVSDEAAVGTFSSTDGLWIGFFLQADPEQNQFPEICVEYGANVTASVMLDAADLILTGGLDKDNIRNEMVFNYGSYYLCAFNHYNHTGSGNVKFRVIPSAGKLETFPVRNSGTEGNTVTIYAPQVSTEEFSLVLSGAGGTALGAATMDGAAPSIGPSIIGASISNNARINPETYTELCQNARTIVTFSECDNLWNAVSGTLMLDHEGDLNFSLSGNTKQFIF